MSDIQPKKVDKDVVPGWMGTYGDMVTLLMAFFVLLYAFSDPDPGKMKELSDSLKGYYLPCKRKYLTDLNEKKCITILRQFIKIHHYKCIGMEKSIKGNKTMTYRLIYSNEDYLTSPEAKKNDEYVLSFE